MAVSIKDSRLKMAEETIETLVNSMIPHPVEHPTMFKAKQRGSRNLASA